MLRVRYQLPYPPSVNHIWRYTRRRTYLSRRAQQYRHDVMAIVCLNGTHTMHGPLRVTLHIHPPDNRKRDIDNVIKIILDSLQCARVYVDDHQVQELHVYRIADRGNYVTVDIVELE